VTDDEILGSLEMITELVSPIGQERLQKAYWDLRLESSRTEASPESK